MRTVTITIKCISEIKYVLPCDEKKNKKEIEKKAVEEYPESMIIQKNFKT